MESMNQSAQKNGYNMDNARSIDSLTELGERGPIQEGLRRAVLEYLKDRENLYFRTRVSIMKNRVYRRLDKEKGIFEYYVLKLDEKTKKMVPQQIDENGSIVEEKIEYTLKG